MVIGRYVITIILSLLLACVHKKGNNSGTSGTDSLTVKIYIDKEGLITANGHAVTLETLAFKLDSLQKRKGVVYYSRANIAAEPPANAIMVMQLITNFGIPVKFYADKNFTKQVHVQQ